MTLKTSMLSVCCANVLVLALAACGGSGGNDGGKVGEGPHGTLRFAAGGDLTNWNTLTPPNATYTSIPYEGLLQTAPDGMTLQPRLAVKWTATSKKLTLTLRQGVTFHDGTPFNAKAVIANVEHIKKSPSEWQHVFDAVASMEAHGDYELTMKLSRPAPTLLANLAARGTFMVSPAALADGSYLQKPVGTSPYVYDAAASVKGSKYVFNYYKKFYDPAEVGPAKIEVQSISDANGRYNAVLARNADVAHMDTTQIDPAKSAGMGTLSWPIFPINMQIFDRNGLFKDVRVRKAMCYAVDKDAISKAQYSGLLQPLTQRYTKGSPAYVPDLTDYPFDLDKARELMKEAGNPKISFKTPVSDATSTQSREVTKANFAKIGINMELVKVTTAQYFGVRYSGQYPWINDTTLSANSGPYAYYQLRFAENGSGNPLKVPPPRELTEAVDAAVAATDPAQQAKHYQEMTRIIHDQALDCGFYNAPGGLMWNKKKVGNIVPTTYSPSAFRYREAKVNAG